jgi:hypothetical protein
MHVYVVTAARMSPMGFPVALKMGIANSVTNQWIEQPREVDAFEVASLLRDGDTVTAAFADQVRLVGGGPTLKYLQLPTGDETVQVEGEPPQGQRLADLPAF